MNTPAPVDLLLRPDLIPKEKIAEHLAMAIKGTAQFERNAVVTCTFKVSWDDETDKLHVTSAVKSKRPVRPKRSEEVLEDEDHILTLVHEIPGQSSLLEAGRESVDAVGKMGDVEAVTFSSGGKSVAIQGGKKEEPGQQRIDGEN